MLKNYKYLKVLQKSYELCLDIYRITAKFPKEERVRSNFTDKKIGCVCYFP